MANIHIQISETKNWTYLMGVVKSLTSEDNWLLVRVAILMKVGKALYILWNGIQLWIIKETDSR